MVGASARCGVLPYYQQLQKSASGSPPGRFGAALMPDSPRLRSAGLLRGSRAGLPVPPSIGRHADVRVVVADAAASHPPEHLFDVLIGEVDEREAVVDVDG